MLHNANLQGLRGIAALIVVFSHASNYFILRHDIKIALANISDFNLHDYILIALFNCGQGAGQIGVMIFFALSGFLLVSKYLYIDFNKCTLLNYYSKRVIRIVPYYYSVVIISILFERFFSTIIFDIKNQEVLFHILFLQGNSVLWTIGPELASYIFIPVVIVLYAHYGNYIVLFYLAAFIIGFYTQQIEFLIINYFLLGQCLAIFLKENSLEKAKTGRLYSIMLLILLYLSFPTAKSLYLPDETSGWGSVQIFILISALLYLSFKFERTVFSNKILCHFGEISFSLYLVHIGIMNFLKGYVTSESDLKLFCISIFLSYCVGLLSFYCIEKPLLTQLRSKLNASSS